MLKIKIVFSSSSCSTTYDVNMLTIQHRSNFRESELFQRNLYLIQTVKLIVWTFICLVCFFFFHG